MLNDANSLYVCTVEHNLKVGDIIVFKTYGADESGQHMIIVHRVAEIITDESNGQKVIRTKGDANPGPIPGADYPILEQNYIGKVVYVIPKLGVITNILHPPTNYILIAFILGGLFYYLRKRNKPVLPSYKKE